MKFLSLFNKKKKTRVGFTLIEAMFVLFIFSLITITFYSIFSTGSKMIIESKNKLKATSLANEKMEIIKSLDYSQIGIVDSGYISGDIPSFEEKTVSGKTFYVFSSVVYIDNPYDGIEGEDPDDSRPADSKRVTLKVAWENDVNTKKAISFVSDFAPPGVEGSTTGGTLVVKVIDKDSNGISGLNVNIKNSSLNINENLETNSNGGVSLPGIPTDNNDYQISISKSGYFSISTLPPYPAATFNPVYVHASVTEGEKNIYSIITDKVSDLVLKTEDPFGNSVSNIAYNLEGGIRKGDTLEVVVDKETVTPSEPVYYFDENLNSGSEGKNEITDISYGNYDFTFSDTSSSYEFIKMFPASTSLNDNTKFSLEPGTTTEVKAIFADKNINSLLATISDNNTASVIKNASVRLFNLSLPEPYDATILTDDSGMAYFPSSLPELVAGTYSLEVQASGYQNKSATVVIDKYTKSNINLETE
jgi:type II secretory pathway pseudopilin PulG